MEQFDSGGLQEEIMSSKMTCLMIHASTQLLPEHIALHDIVHNMPHHALAISPTTTQ